MKRAGASNNRLLTRVVCALCAVFVVAMSGCAGFQAPEGVVHHSDPSTVRERYEAWLLFAHLGAALQSVASEDFGRSDEQFAALNVERAHLPSSLLDLAARYTDLCNELADGIEALYDSLERFERMLDANDLRGASAELSAARALLSRAREQLDALEQATLEVFALLRRSGAGGTTAQLEQSRQSLDAALARLLQLALEYESRLEAAESAVEQKRVLLQPELTLRFDRDAAWVGETLVLSGSARTASGPLGDREVLLLLDGIETVRTRTDSSGHYSCDLTLPYDYVPLRVIQAAYQPVGADLERYRPAYSEELILTVRFHQTTLSLEPPNRLHPGLSSELVGVVSSAGTIGLRDVTVRWVDTPVGHTASTRSGTFVCTVLLPDDATEGAGVLVVEIAGDDEARTAPATVEVDVNVRRLAPEVKVNVAPLLFVPSASLSLPRQILGGDFVRMVPVSGEIRSSLPLEGPAVVAYWGDRQVRWQQNDSQFERGVPLDTSIWSMGIRTVTVRVIPREPWHKPTEVYAHLVVVNLFVPVVWSVALAAALAAGAAVRRRHLGVARPARETPVVDEAGLTSAVLPGRSHVAEDEDSNPRLLVVSMYYSAVALIQSTLGVMLRREMTLREYLASAVTRTPTASRFFGGITMLTEKALYDRIEPVRRDVSLGRKLLSAFRMTFRHADGNDESGET